MLLCLHALCMCHMAYTCFIARAHLHACLVSGVRAGETLEGMRYLRCSERTGRACGQNGAFRRLSIEEISS